MAKPGKLQTSLEYLLARTILSGLGILPRPVAIVVGLAIGRVAYLLPMSLRRTGKRNLETRARQINPAGKSLKILSSPPAKNIPLNPSGKSSL